MAIMITLLSGLAGLIIAIVALIGYGATWTEALAIYLVSATLPVVLLMTATYLNILFKNTFAQSDAPVEAQRIR